MPLHKHSTQSLHKHQCIQYKRLHWNVIQSFLHSKKLFKIQNTTLTEIFLYASCPWKIQFHQCFHTDHTWVTRQLLHHIEGATHGPVIGNQSGTWPYLSLHILQCFLHHAWFRAARLVLQILTSVQVVVWDMTCSECYAASIFTSIQKLEVVCHSELLVSTSSLCSVTTQTATN